MEILRRRGEIADLDIVLGAELKETLEARGGVRQVWAWPS